MVIAVCKRHWIEKIFGYRHGLNRQRLVSIRSSGIVVAEGEVSLCYCYFYVHCCAHKLRVWLLSSVRHLCGFLCKSGLLLFHECICAYCHNSRRINRIRLPVAEPRTGSHHKHVVSKAQKIASTDEQKFLLDKYLLLLLLLLHI